MSANMHKIPIAFCFDDNLLMPAGVCLTSLLEHANENTFYDIFILHDDKSKFPQSGYLEKLKDQYQNFNITYRNVGNAFEGAFEIRGITVAAYYRLLIPKIIPEYNTIMYHDVDVVFRDDLSKLFLNTDMKGYYMGGVSTPYSDITEYVEKNIGVGISSYIASGNLIINSEEILRDNLIPKFIETAKKSWYFQDMDVINIVCKGRIKYLPPSFCIVGTTAEILSDINQPYFPKGEADYARKFGIIHYNGAKPWKTWCLNFDIWWEYYRKSVFYDPKFYFDYYHNKLDEYDKLSLWKRIKILLRYFKTRL
ncbi:glycosyltransferase family 8 protein [Elizabethkingia ursingii]|uniref:Stress protein n=1 Tax=Elizabethkingia ursingii TaxID=1756150 RepID=A0AAJ3TNN6_9FLAO|nr:glycosyltransferase family 8 protein [Elizabethkingia ursingii]MDR2229215.1 glycosyltransferase family 8 protein [Flavobacteriaceae bacterium]AQX08237.1 stress protein [Elizabethkingia ursingii]OPB73407.1 stress protein [Elizabethkingia ursingii]OPB86925.1 stress protein [Elizabethkingia ursingii]OPC00366.1 stress protein [Elizabethkingia ursingii]